MKKNPQSVDSKVIRRIRRRPVGWVFAPRHFADLGSRDAVAAALRRYKKAGTIRQIARGLYDRPRYSELLGKYVPPTDEAIIECLKDRDGVRFQPAGPHAANMLGLSTQVPAKTVFLTDGPTRRLQIGRRQILLKQTTVKNMATAGRASGFVIQALRWLGQRYGKQWRGSTVWGHKLDRQRLLGVIPR